MIKVIIIIAYRWLLGGGRDNETCYILSMYSTWIPCMVLKKYSVSYRRDGD